MYELQAGYFMYLKKVREGIYSYTKAIELQGDYSLYYCRASAYRLLDKPSESIADFDTYLKHIGPGIMCLYYPL